MRGQVRRQELTCPETSEDPAQQHAALAAARLLGIYAGLAERGAHLLGGLLAGAPPRQWERLPEDDAVDSAGLYQWFYHCHGPEDRPESPEHGHIHLFARRPLWRRLARSRAERAFHALCGQPASDAGTRHLLGIGLDPKGVPVSLFAVNSWVTGDLMLSAAATARLLSGIALDTGHPDIDGMIASLVRLCEEDIAALLDQRDRALASRPADGVLEDRTLDVLAETRLDIDGRIARALAARPA